MTDDLRAKRQEPTMTTAKELAEKIFKIIKPSEDAIPGFGDMPRHQIESLIEEAIKEAVLRNTRAMDNWNEENEEEIRSKARAAALEEAAKIADNCFRYSKFGKKVAAKIREQLKGA